MVLTRLMGDLYKPEKAGVKEEPEKFIWGGEWEAMTKWIKNHSQEIPGLQTPQPTQAEPYCLQ